MMVVIDQPPHLMDEVCNIAIFGRYQVRQATRGSCHSGASS